MREEEIQQDTASQKPKSDSSFWSPWAVLFLGVWFGALNWWRMGNKRKAIAFLVAAGSLSLLDRWFDVRNAELYLFQLSVIVLGLKAGIFLAFAALVADVVRVDIREFRWSGKKPVPTHWSIMIVFFIIATVLPAILNYSLYSLPAIQGRCPFPRFQNVAYYFHIRNRVGIEKLFLNSIDFGCGWYWFGENTFTFPHDRTDVIQSRSYDLNGVYASVTEPKSSIRIMETVYQLDHPVTKELFTQFLADARTGYSAESDWLAMDISEYDLQNLLSEARCRKLYDEKNCMIYLADQSLIVRLVATWQGDVKLNDYVKQATEKTAQRLLQYSESP